MERAICARLKIDPESLGERPEDVLRRLKPRMRDPQFLAQLSNWLDGVA